MGKTTNERFWEKVNKSGECWTWTACTHHQWGYGHFRAGGKLVTAHRYSWELHNGPIPPGMRVCHRCDNPPCVRPAHLFLGTDADNAHDMIAKGRHYRGEHNSLKTHCPHGHEYTPDNTRVYVNKNGWRMRFCIECDRAFSRTAYHKHKAKRRVSARAYMQRQRAENLDEVRRKAREYMRAHRARKKADRDHREAPR